MQRDWPIVVFSHLRWDFVYQRPQHLMSRLARRGPVVFVEEPMYEAGPPRLETSRPAEGVQVVRPFTPLRAPGFDAEQMPLLTGMLADFAATARLEQPVAWLYTPLALPMADALRPSGVVYDCMDELSMFLGAPPELLHREAELLQRADVVFTGGPSLYAAKRDRHPNVHCFPSSVDASHFGAARPGGTLAEPADQAGIPHPRLGFYGVIDERIDLGILDHLAATNPAWQIVMVGPVVKIDPATLPRHQNIHYVGQRRYEELPAYLSGWTLSLLPFALNDATRFISPTKTLEYMAAERPIVSTPIADVAGPYGDIVYLGRGPAEFAAACAAALAAPDEERARRSDAMRDVLSRTSWDATAEAMQQAVGEALGRALEVTARVPAA
jgi:UDP-galactopyranose mutase